MALPLPEEQGSFPDEKKKKAFYASLLPFS